MELAEIPTAPTPSPPDGAALLDQVEEALRVYTVQQSQHEYVALALYVAYTHVYEAFTFAPRLVVTSAEKRSGKTRTLEIVAALCRNPVFTANATTAALYRMFKILGTLTLIFDEADTVFNEKIKSERNEELRGLINAGFSRDTPVYRANMRKGGDVEAFNTFAPIVLAAIGQLPDTISDRAVNIRLRRRKAGETVKPYRARFELPQLQALATQLGDWLTPHLDELAEATPETGLTDRAADVWEAFIAIADLAGGTWPERARQAATYLVRQAAEADKESSSLGVELLADIQTVLPLWGDPDFIPTEKLLELLRSMEESRWLTEGITPHSLAQLLKPYGIHPSKAKNGKKRGYKISQFADVFERYLSKPVNTNEATPASPEQQQNEMFSIEELLS